MPSGFSFQISGYDERQREAIVDYLSKNVGRARVNGGVRLEKPYFDAEEIKTERGSSNIMRVFAYDFFKEASDNDNGFRGFESKDGQREALVGLIKILWELDLISAKT
jgi:hypothetical protein